MFPDIPRKKLLHRTSKKPSPTTSKIAPNQ
jgi:hypothetical protein